MSTQAAPMSGLVMKWVRFEDGTYGVDLTVYGLASQQQAELAMEFMQRQFCSTEVKKEEMQ